MADEAVHLDLSAGIVSAFVSHNNVRPAELPDLIASVHAAFVKLGAPPPVEEHEPEMKPAVPVKKSVTPDYLISLEDGKRYVTLRRHLGRRGLTPDAYRAKWGLPKDYPMTAPAYTARRSELALAAGLGRKSAAEILSHTALAPAAPPEPTRLAPMAEQDATLAKRRGRLKKPRVDAPQGS